MFGRGRKERAEELETTIGRTAEVTEGAMLGEASWAEH
jgi:hypothetical protein